MCWYRWDNMIEARGNGGMDRFSDTDMSNYAMEKLFDQ